MKDITPDHLRCHVGMCPAVYDLGDGRLLIIGARPSDDVIQTLGGGLNPDEQAVVVDLALLHNAAKLVADKHK